MSRNWWYADSCQTGQANRLRRFTFKPPGTQIDRLFTFHARFATFPPGGASHESVVAGKFEEIRKQQGEKWLE
jgi:hypothetical protein